MAERKRRNFFKELIVLLVTVVVLTAVTVPMYTGYAAELALNSARGDLKMLYSSVEAYFTEHRQVPDDPQNAVKDWEEGYSARYKYTKTDSYVYQFSTKEKYNKHYLLIDQNGVIQGN